MSALKVPIKTLLYASGNKSGVWEAGVACEKNGGVTDYWNTEVTFKSSTSDPNGFTWAAKAGACKADATEGFYSAAAATFTGGTYHAFTVASSGCPTPTYTETGALPTGVAFTKAGLLSGVPTEGGAFKLTFTAEIGTGAKKTQAFTLTIPFYIVTQTLAAAKPGTKYSTTLKASGGTAPYKWTETTPLPTALKLTVELGRGAVGNGADRDQGQQLHRGDQGDRLHQANGQDRLEELHLHGFLMRKALDGGAPLLRPAPPPPRTDQDRQGRKLRPWWPESPR